MTIMPLSLHIWNCELERRAVRFSLGVIGFLCLSSIALMAGCDEPEPSTPATVAPTAESLTSSAPEPTVTTVAALPIEIPTSTPEPTSTPLPANQYGVDATVPDFPHDRQSMSQGRVRLWGLNAATTPEGIIVAFDNGGIWGNSRATYTCISSGGCRVENGRVTQGVIEVSDPEPTATPRPTATPEPTSTPTPTPEPTSTPTPTPEPTSTPTPTPEPTSTPTPTPEPTSTPTPTPEPTSTPTPTPEPTSTPTPTPEPTSTPLPAPTVDEFNSAPTADEQDELLDRATVCRVGVSLMPNEFCVGSDRTFIAAHLPDGSGLVRRGGMTVQVGESAHLGWISFERQGGARVITHLDES